MDVDQNKGRGACGNRPYARQPAVTRYAVNLLRDSDLIMILVSASW